MNEIVEGLSLVWQARKFRDSSLVHRSKVSQLVLSTSKTSERITKEVLPNNVSTISTPSFKLPSNTTSIAWPITSNAIELHPFTAVPFTTKISPLGPFVESSSVPSTNFEVRNLIPKPSTNVSTTSQYVKSINTSSMDQRSHQRSDTTLVKEQLLEVFSKISRRQILTRAFDLWRTSTIEILKEIKRKKEEQEREMQAKFVSIQTKIGQKRKSNLLNIWRTISATLKAHKAKQKYIASNLAVTSPISPINDQATKLSKVTYRIKPSDSGANSPILFSQKSSSDVKTVNIPSLIQFVLQRKPRLQFFLKLLICTDAVNRLEKSFLDFVDMFRRGKVDPKWNRVHQNAYEIETLSLYKCTNHSDLLTNSSLYITIQSLIFYSPIDEISVRFKA